MSHFRFLTAGESHGQALTVVVEGVPAGLALDEEYIVRDLQRRQGGYGRGGRMQIEQDRAQILSGVRYGRTMGTPIGMKIDNRDWENWHEVMAVEPVEKEPTRVTRLRPGHADLTGSIKYGLDDVRNVLERASARETAARVAVGAVARALLEALGVAVHSHVVEIGGIKSQVDGLPDWSAVESSEVRCADPEAGRQMVAAIDAAREAGDTVGGIVEVMASGVPIGLGSHVHWDRKLDGLLAQAMLSINAFKGVEFGAGFAAAGLRGSQMHDVFRTPVQANEAGHWWQRQTNRAGGIEGGISNGEDIVMRCVVKPIPTLARPLPSADLISGEEVRAHYERSDVCVVPAAGVVAEAMTCLVLADAALDKFGGDSLAELLRNYQGYLKTTGPRGKGE